MINFPVAGGTSGHLLGGALASIILGPWSGILIMTSVIGLQSLLFQEGGLVVMGANIFNMGILTSLIGYELYAIVKDRNRKILVGGIAFAAWLSVLASALSTSFQIWLSGISPARVVFPAMISVHALIGFGEALITVAAFSFINQVRPDIIEKKVTRNASNHGWIIIGSLISLSVVLISPFASVNPDGLERVAADLSFIQFAQETPYSIFADYIIPSMGESGVSTILAVAIGVIVVGIITYLAGKFITRRSSEEPTS